jgi:hypothetical protein
MHRDLANLAVFCRFAHLGTLPVPAGPLSGCQPVLCACIEGKRVNEGRLCPHHRHEWLNTDDVYYAREIIGEHVQCHLGGYLRQALHQKVRGAHPHLQRRERMLGCLAPLAHRLGVLIETLLRGFEHVEQLRTGIL